MMDAWPTRDGYILRLSDRGLRTMSGQLEDTGLGPSVLNATWCGVPRAVTRSVGRLATGSRRIGALRNPRNGRSHPVFRATADGRRMWLITRPVAARVMEVESVKPEPDPFAPEFESKKITGAATIRWERPRSISQAARAKGKAIYIIEKGGKPINVGIVKRRDVGARMQDRLRVMRDLGVNQGAYRVRIGRVTGNSMGPPENLEHVLVQFLKKEVPGVRLTNDLPRARFRVGPRGVEVHNRRAKGGVLPDYLRGDIKISRPPAGKTILYEMHDPPFLESLDVA